MYRLTRETARGKIVLDQAADIATALGFPIAAIAGIAALCSYRSAKRAAADAHMHSLFREYFLARLDFHRSAVPVKSVAGDVQSRSKQPAPRPEAATPAENDPVDPANGRAERTPSIEGQLAALKLYALEAMWEWGRQQERALQQWAWLARTTSWQTQRDVLHSWKETIVVHLDEDKEQVLKSIETFPQCYSLSFLEFAAETKVLDAARLNIAIASRNELRKLELRPADVRPQRRGGTGLLTRMQDVLAFHKGERGGFRVRTGEDIKTIRSKTGLSKSKFAAAYHLEPATLRDWEQGRRQPDRPAQMLLELIEREPETVRRILAG